MDGAADQVSGIDLVSIVSPAPTPKYEELRKVAGAVRERIALNVSVRFKHRYSETCHYENGPIAVIKQQTAHATSVVARTSGYALT